MLYSENLHLFLEGINQATMFTVRLTPISFYSIWTTCFFLGLSENLNS